MLKRYKSVAKEILDIAVKFFYIVALGCLKTSLVFDRILFVECGKRFDFREQHD